MGRRIGSVGEAYSKLRKKVLDTVANIYVEHSVTDEKINGMVNTSDGKIKGVLV